MSTNTQPHEPDEKAFNSRIHLIFCMGSDIFNVVTTYVPAISIHGPLGPGNSRDIDFSLDKTLVCALHCRNIFNQAIKIPIPKGSYIISNPKYIMEYSMLNNYLVGRDVLLPPPPPPFLYSLVFLSTVR